MRLLNRITGTISGRLSRHRRGPAAGLAVLVIGLLMTGGLYAALAPANASYDEEDDAAEVAKGRQLFLVGCAFCHGQNGEGIRTANGDQIGPPLVGVGAAAVDFQVGTGRMPQAQPGVQAPRKDVVYTDEEITQLAAYVASFGPGPAIPTEEQYSVEGLSEEEQAESVVRGGEFFRTNCTACHNFAGSGGALSRGKYAPELTGVSDKHTYEAMLTGPQQMPVFSENVLLPEDKRDIIAYLNQNEETPEYGGFSMGALGPVSEGMFAWLVGVGSLLGFAVWIAAKGTRSTKKKVTP